MGYTHYVRRHHGHEIPQDAWVEFLKDLLKLAAAYGPCELAIDLNEICINGLVEKEQCEPLVIPRIENDDGFSFCKTHAYPYDRLVVAALALISERCPELQVSSDGTAQDWQPDLDWASGVLERPVLCPFQDSASEGGAT